MQETNNLYKLLIIIITKIVPFLTTPPFIPPIQTSFAQEECYLFKKINQKGYLEIGIILRFKPLKTAPEGKVSTNIHDFEFARKTCNQIFSQQTDMTKSIEKEGEKDEFLAKFYNI